MYHALYRPSLSFATILIHRNFYSNMAYCVKVCYHEQVAWSKTRNVTKYGGPIEKLASYFHDQEICCQDRYS